MCPYISKRKIGLKTNHKEREDRRNNKWGIFYQDRRWKRLREWYISNHPLCEECLFEGRSVPAENIHHKRPFSEGETTEEKFALLLDPENLQALCIQHHQEKHRLLNQSKQ